MGILLSVCIYMDYIQPLRDGCRKQRQPGGEQWKWTRSLPPGIGAWDCVTSFFVNINKRSNSSGRLSNWIPLISTVRSSGRSLWYFKEGSRKLSLPGKRSVAFPAGRDRAKQSWPIVLRWPGDSRKLEVASTN